MSARELPTQDRRTDVDYPLRVSCSAARVVVAGGSCEMMPEKARDIAGALLFYADEAERLAGTWMDWDFLDPSLNPHTASSRGWRLLADGETWAHPSGARAEKHGELWYPRRSTGESGAGVADAGLARWYALATLEQTKDAAYGPKRRGLIMYAIGRVAEAFENGNEAVASRIREMAPDIATEMTVVDDAVRNTSPDDIKIIAPVPPK